VRGVATDRPVTRALGLRGRHQWANAWVAVAALDQLPAALGNGVGGEVPASFASAFVPGRFDVRGAWIFDVAHNPDGMAVLAAALDDTRPRRPLHALVGIRTDKEWRPMLETLAPHVDRMVLTLPPSVPPPQQWQAAELVAWAAARSGAPAAVVEVDFAAALAAVRRDAATALVTGSFHTVGDALARLPGFAPLG
jgi:dihydrofolate synthase/folylpolyglutamate synthase